LRTKTCRLRFPDYKPREETTVYVRNLPELRKLEERAASNKEEVRDVEAKAASDKVRDIEAEAALDEKRVLSNKGGKRCR
jgi:hypothetical protein